MAERSRSLAGRALVMLALFIGFYLLAIVVAVALILAPVLEIAFADRLHFQLVFVAFVGLAILWSLVPRRREQWVDPGPRFTAETQPDLTQLVRRVAREVGQPMPDELYLLDDLNAFVTTRGGVMGFGGRRVLAVGVPLMMVLDTDELASVLAHEFGHLHGGDTRLLPLVYRTRGAMERTLNAATGFVQGIFKAYASFYLARSQGISRAQEFAADRLAARVTSARAAASALARLPLASAAFEYYRNTEYAPVLAAGRQPAYFSGFQGTLASATVPADGPGLSADVAVGDHTHSRFDSHPSPLDRIRALGVDPRTLMVEPRPASPATALLRNPEGVQAALVARHTGDFPTDRAPVRWEDVGTQVLLPGWRASANEQLLAAAPSLRPAGVPIDRDGLAELGSAVYQHAGMTATRPERERAAQRLCGQYLAVAAADAGWTVESLPGHPIRFLRDGTEWNLFDDYTRVCAGTLDPDVWRSRLSAAGLGEMVSTTPAASPTAPDGRLRHDTAPSATAVHDATPTASTATTVAPAQGSVLRYRGKPVLRRELVIDGNRLQWGDEVVDAREVTALGYRLVNNQWDGRFTTPSGELRFKVSTGKKASEAWSALMRWSELYVQPRLVDDLLARLRETGSVEIDDVAFTAEGITPRKGPLVPWDEFAGTTFTGAHVTLHRRADNLDGHAQFGAVRTHVRNGGGLVPALCQAIMASRA